MEKQKRMEIYAHAINKWGNDSQINMLNEECGELITAVAQLPRGRVSEHDVLTELADVHIMVEQIALILGYDKFEKEKDRKLERLRERLKLNGGV